MPSTYFYPLPPSYAARACSENHFVVKITTTKSQRTQSGSQSFWSYNPNRLYNFVHFVNSFVVEKNDNIVTKGTKRVTKCFHKVFHKDKLITTI